MQRERAYSKVANRLYGRSPSRVAGRDSIHNAITNYFGSSNNSKARGNSITGRGRGGSSRRFSGTGGGGDRHRGLRSSSSRRYYHRRANFGDVELSSRVSLSKKVPASGGAAGLTGLTSLSKSLGGQMPASVGMGLGTPAGVDRRKAADGAGAEVGMVGVAQSRRVPSREIPSSGHPPRGDPSSGHPPRGVPPRGAPSRRGLSRVYSTAYSIQSLASSRGFESSSGSDSGSLSRYARFLFGSFPIFWRGRRVRFSLEHLKKAFWSRLWPWSLFYFFANEGVRDSCARRRRNCLRCPANFKETSRITIANRYPRRSNVIVGVFVMPKRLRVKKCKLIDGRYEYPTLERRYLPCGTSNCWCRQPTSSQKHHAKCVNQQACG